MKNLDFFRQNFQMSKLTKKNKSKSISVMLGIILPSSIKVARARELNNSLERTIEESIKIESNASGLYGLFSQIFEEDKDFWWQLKLEEKNHFTLLVSAKKALLDYNKFPQEIVSDSLKSLIDTNNNLRKMIDDFSSNPPSREIAFNTALKVEISAGEIHYQEAMKQPEGSEILKILQKINGDDKEHEQRIREYMKREGIKIFESY